MLRLNRLVIGIWRICIARAATKSYLITHTTPNFYIYTLLPSSYPSHQKVPLNSSTLPYFSFLPLFLACSQLFPNHA